MYMRNFKLAFLLLLQLSIQQAIHCKPGIWQDLLGKLTSPQVRGDEDVAPCGYQSCPKTLPGKINVHIIAHTHDDVGWIKTVDQYFYGVKKSLNSAGVQYILDSIIPALLMDKSKRFIYVEMSFFSKWWEEQDDRMKSVVKQLVNEGRLEFINGGWCMNDEATVTYHSTIEQMTLGLKFLNETFGQCGHPKVGWQIDPFGHSNEQASLFAQFGFDGMFFTRISYLDKQHRTLNKSLDLIWHGDRALPGQSGSIFTNVFRDGYDAPQGYCYDAFCHDDVVVDNKKSYEYNVDAKGEFLIEFIREYSASKLTKQLLVPFGGDFQFSAAGQNFKNIDKLMRYIRERAPDINIFYSTPSCYQYSVYKEVRNQTPSIRLPEKYNDFMPYDSSYSVWWSGYFTSRPSVKLIEREVANLLQVARMISFSTLLKTFRAPSGPDNGSSSPSIADANQWIEMVELHETKCLRPLWEILGDLQHHDAITGTERQLVTDDYIRRAKDAIDMCAEFIGGLKRELLDKSLDKAPRLEEAGKIYHLDPVYLEGTTFCTLLNISQCDPLNSNDISRRYVPVKTASATESSSSAVPKKNAQTPRAMTTKGVLMTIYNPLARALNQVDIRLPCKGKCDLSKIQVTQLATKQQMELLRLPVAAGVDDLPFRDAVSENEILFYVDMPGLGSKSFVINDENDDYAGKEIFTDDSSVDMISSVYRDADEPLYRGTRATEPMATPKPTNVDSGVRGHYENFYMRLNSVDSENDERQATKLRKTRVTRGLSHQHHRLSDYVTVKVDMDTGLIAGLKRQGDENTISLKQRFGFYYPANYAAQPGAYTFRPNSSEPDLMTKPTKFKVHKRRNNTLIEIHQTWADWISQTIRLDSKKNYIEFDYVVGPIPELYGLGREVVTRYETSIDNGGVFFTDSNARQLMPRQRLISDDPAQLGGSFYPLASTILIHDNKPTRASEAANVLAILVDRSQAGTSLNKGNLELLIHRRHTRDDNWGVGEALNEPGEDGRGLVVRGKHRLYLGSLVSNKSKPPAPENGSQNETNALTMVRLPDTPRSNLTYEMAFTETALNQTLKDLPPTYLIYSQLLNEIRQESIKYTLRPMLTFDKLRVSANEFMHMFDSDTYALKSKSGISLLNSTLPTNIHLLTLQPWNKGPNQLLIRLENLDNPLTLHPLPSPQVYKTLLQSYESVGREIDLVDPCSSDSWAQTQFDIEYLIKDIRITNLGELRLGANVRLADDKRINWTDEQATLCNSSRSTESTTSITLGPRQIRTFLLNFVFL